MSEYSLDLSSKLTHCISTWNNLPYLKLCIESVRENGFYKNADFFIYAENCTDGTDEWLKENAEKYKLRYLIEKNDPPVGIGGGMNKCAENVKTDLINFLHSDFYVSKDFDVPLVKGVLDNDKTLISSWRVEPHIYEIGQASRLGTLVAPPEFFGEFHHNFNKQKFLEWVEMTGKRHPNYQPFRKCEGVSYCIKKSDWDCIGGCDPLFAPSSYEDSDLFLRMVCEGYNFLETSQSWVYHFVSRSVHIGDDNTKKSERQMICEAANRKKWMDKWGIGFRLNNLGFIDVIEHHRQRYKELYKNEKSN